MFNFSGSEIVFLLLLALIILGPEKLPEAVRKFTKTYAEFKKVTTGFQSELKQVLDEPIREMRETADAFKKAATLDVDTSVFTDPFGKAVSSADQRGPTAEEQAAQLAQATPGPAPVPSATAGNEPPLVGQSTYATPIAEPATAEPATAEPATAEPATAEPAADAPHDDAPATTTDDSTDGAAPA